MERLTLICALFMAMACGGDDSSPGSHEDDGSQDGPNSGEEDQDAAADPMSGDAAAGDEADAAPATNVQPGVDCMGACELVVAPGCENGPPSVSLCVILCEATIDGDNETCREAFQDLLDCLDPTAQVTCTEEGDTTSDRCAAEFEALTPCLPQG